MFAMEESPSTALEDYKLFEVVQGILDITDELRKEFKEKYDINISSGRKKWLESNPFCYQTQQGLFICICSGKFSSSLSTPWGEVKLIVGGRGDCGNFQAFRQAFFKRLKTSFCSISQPYSIIQPLSTPSPNAGTTFYELKSNDIDLTKKYLEKKERTFEGIFREITPEELQNKVGQDTFLCSSSDSCDAIYKIHSVDGEQLPEAEFLALQNYKEYEIVNLAWKKLEEKYEASRS